MFDTLAGRFTDILAGIRGRGRIDEKDVAEASRQIRLALLEADVNFKVVKEIVADVKSLALGESVLKSLTPGQQVVKVLRDELARVMGESAVPLRIGKRPDVIILAGLQGCGKTTAAAKLALYLRREGKKTLLVAADTYRPAAQDQLVSLGAELGVDVWRGEPGQTAVDIASAAVQAESATPHDVVIVDTAGRLHIDDELMREIVALKTAVTPGHILFVADAMIGQDAVNQASAFDDALDFDGVILTKLDGDARGGAALSIKQVTGKPIMFVSTGEKPQDFEVFHPDRMAARILGMGDVISLIERAESAVDESEARALAEKLEREAFTLDDFLSQLEQISKMGGLNDMISMLPSHMLPKELRGAEVEESGLGRTKAIIQSMTSQERQTPRLIDGSRRARIARGSGTTVTEVNGLLKQFEAMRKMVKSAQGKSKKRGWPAGFPG